MCRFLMEFFWSSTMLSPYSKKGKKEEKGEHLEYLHSWATMTSWDSLSSQSLSFSLSLIQPVFSVSFGAFYLLLIVLIVFDSICKLFICSFRVLIIMILMMEIVSILHHTVSIFPQAFVDWVISPSAIFYFVHWWS